MPLFAEAMAAEGFKEVEVPARMTKVAQVGDQAPNRLGKSGYVERYSTWALKQPSLDSGK